jgi:hypothetical protein
LETGHRRGPGTDGEPLSTFEVEPYQTSATTTKESHMPEKSPQKPAGKKPGKSLKEKREAKKDKKENRSGLGR